MSKSSKRKVGGKVVKFGRRCPKCRSGHIANRTVFWLCLDCQFPWLKRGQKA